MGGEHAGVHEVVEVLCDVRGDYVVSREEEGEGGPEGYIFGLWGVPVDYCVRVEELSEGCIAFLWDEECQLEVLTQGLLGGVDVRFPGVPWVSRKCAV